MPDLLIDALADSVKLIPFLFFTYLLMEFLEHHAGGAAEKCIRAAGRSGPVWGGILGLLPQCGFSAAAAGLFSGRVITVGTLIAVFLSTSDEMLPLMISNGAPASTILRILGTKASVGILSGLLVDFVVFGIWKKQREVPVIGRLCEEEHCHCQEGIFLSAVRHTVKITVYIFIFSICLNGLIGLVGEDALSVLFFRIPLVGEATAALVGLIPNCASSVILTELYFEEMIGAGALMAGLCVNAGVGLLILFRMNRNRRQNAKITAVLYGLGVFWGVMIEAAGIRF